MPAQPNNVVQAKQTRKKPTTVIAGDRGPHSVIGLAGLSKEDCLSTGDVSPPKLSAMGALDLSDSSLVARLARAFGTKDLDSIGQLITQVLPTNPRLDVDDPKTWNSVFAMLHDIAPKDALEGILAVQMVGVHQAAMEFLGRAMVGHTTLQATDANVNRANKLLRTFTAQLEALNRHRGKITQAMVVGNVNVNDGGQAIVGAVNHPGPGKVSKDDEEKKVG
jgi:hypothetical protein